MLYKKENFHQELELVITTRGDKESDFGFNLAFHVGEKEELVKKRREKIKNLFGGNKSLIIPSQIHSNSVKVVEDSSHSFVCDGLITHKEELILGVLVADCVPLAFLIQKKGFLVLPTLVGEGA